MNDEPGPDPRDLSRNFVLFAALALVVVGVLVAWLASSKELDDPILMRVSEVGAEGLMSAGLALLVVTLAFHDRIETSSAVKDTFVSTCLPKIDAEMTKHTNALEDLLDTRFGESSKNLEKFDRVISTLREELGPKVHVFGADQIYKRSIELLESFKSGGTVHILMAADENLGTGSNGSSADGSDGSGELWLTALKKWVDAPGHHVERVIAVPESQAENDVAHAEKVLLEPFRGKSVSQWFLRDEEFALSVMVMGYKYSVFGFPAPKANAEHLTAFQRAVAVEHEELAMYLADWFKATFPKEPARQVMRNGTIDREMLNSFKDGMAAPA